MATATRNIDALRDEYRELYRLFEFNKLDPSPFTDRLRGETDPEKIHEGVRAMRVFLIYRGVKECDPNAGEIDPDNVPEYQLAFGEEAHDYLELTPVKSVEQSVPTQHATGTPTMKLGVPNPEPKQFYFVGHIPFHIKKGRNGNVYAERKNAQGKWEYAKGAIFQIRERGRLASFDDIAKFGLASGFCYVCNKKLSDPVSVKLGIGPKCRKRWGR